MKHLRKSILMLLALTLFGGAGAWAQGPTAAEINADVYSGWTSIDGKLFKASELPGFQAVTEDQAKSWAGVPSTGIVVLYYEFVADGHAKYVGFVNGVYEGSYEDDELTCYLIYEDIYYNGNTKYFYTTGSAAIELTKEGANQWSLGQTPDYDLELQVEYYEAHALKNIPAGWQVKVNGVDKTAAIDGDSLMITETDSVTLVPAGNPRRVKSVTLVDNSTPPAVYLEATTTAWADGINYAVPAEGLTYGDAVTVSGNVTLTLTEGTTLTLNKGISMAEGATLTVTGPGTLVVNGAKGNDGGYDIIGGTGGNGGVAISGNIIVQGGATVTATGGAGGTGGNGEFDGGPGGNGGNAFAGTLTYKSGTVTANGGSAGSGGWGTDVKASSGSAGKAFANDVDFTQTTGYSVTDGTSTIGSVLNQTKVVISGGTPIPTGN